MRADLFEHFGIAVENGHVGTEADRHLRGIEADHAAADHHDLAGHHARDTAKQHAASAMRLFERGSARLHAHPAGHLAHRLEQRQLAARTGHGLIGDRGDAAVEQFLRLVRIGCQVQVSVEDLALAQLLALDRLRLLDLHHHFAFGEDRIGTVDDFRPCGDILVVIGVDAGTRLGLDPHLVALHDELFRALGRQADAVFVVLDFLGAADAHGGTP